MKYIYIDFEFNGSNESSLNLVCSSWLAPEISNNMHNAWLYKKPVTRKKLNLLLHTYHEEGYIFVAYAATAESRAFLALHLEAVKYRWIDLYLEFRQLRNGCDKYNYGEYYFNNMRLKSYVPSYNPKKNEGVNNKKLSYSMADACARMLGVNIDKGVKTVMRDLILEAKDEYSKEEQEDILEYCDSDVKYLPKLHMALNKALNDLLKPYSRKHEYDLEKAQLLRGEFAADVAIMEEEGIPLHMESIKNLRRNVGFAKEKLIKDLVENYYPFFERRKKKTDLIGRWVDTHNNFKEFINNHESINEKSWKVTESGAYCTDDEYLKTWEGIPEIKAYREVRKILGQLKWLRVPKGNESDLFDAIGSDGRMRSFFGIYGTQTARNAPKAKRFLFAMSAWLRCLIRPPKGYVITELDFAQQEFAIAAVLSKDKNMVEAYKSGDVYFHFAKLAKAVPMDALRKDHEEKRNLFKATVLGLQYGMGAKSLGTKLTSDTGKLVSESDAMKLIDLHRKSFPTYWSWLNKVDRTYSREKTLMLPCGWALFGDNTNVLSTRNMPTQGSGSSVIRRAVKLIRENGIKQIATLHDADYIISKEENLKHEIKIAKKCMIDAFEHYLGNTLKIRVDVHSHVSNEPWISEKGARHYEILKEYLEHKDTDEDIEKKLDETVFKEIEYE